MLRFGDTVRHLADGQKVFVEATEDAFAFCRMSMEIMGMKKEELIDGVKMGGAATFLGSGK